MSGATSDAFRGWVGTPGAPSIKDAWGTFLNDNTQLIAAIATGLSSVNIAGLSTYTLTANSYAADQSRPLMQDYTGALTGNCTVTLPNVQKFGWARNSTTGSHNVLLTSGGGTQATILPGAYWHAYWCDGAGNVVNLSPAFSTGKYSGALTVGSLTSTGLITGSAGAAITGDSSVAGALTVSTAGTSGNQVVNFSQFSQDISANGRLAFPGGAIWKWGKALRNGTGSIPVSFSPAFGFAVYSITATAISGTAADPVSVTGESKNGFTLNVTHSNVDVYWMAIGS